MKKWDEYFTAKNTKPPEPIIKYYYLENGISYGPINEKPVGKKVVERVVFNQKEIDEYWNNIRFEREKAETEWYDDLRIEFSELSDGIFKACYSQAWEDGHSSGYDEIGNIMYDIVEFAKNIIKIHEKEKK